MQRYGSRLHASFAQNTNSSQKSWVDPDTCHRIIRLTDEPGSASLYFNDNGYTRDGKEIYNGSIAAGGSYNGVGFNGTWNGSVNSIPTNYAINGTACH